MGTTKTLTVYNDSPAGGATITTKVPVHGVESMVVLWYISDSGAVGDIGATTVRAYTSTEEAGPALITNPIPGTVIAAATRNDPQASKWDRYDVRGLETVQLSFVNNAGGAKNLQIHVYLYTS